MTYQDTVYLFWHQNNAAGTPALPNQVLRYDIPTHTVLPVGTIGLSVLGASAVPCAQVTR